MAIDAKRLLIGSLVAALVAGCEAPYDHGAVTVAPGVIGPGPEHPRKGVLVVRTDVLRVEEDTLVYHPHRSYEIRDLAGRRVRRVRNHVGPYDESPARVPLDPGVYRVHARRVSGELLTVDVRVEAGRVTEIDVNDLPRPGDPRG